MLHLPTLNFSWSSDDEKVDSLEDSCPLLLDDVCIVIRRPTLTDINVFSRTDSRVRLLNDLKGRIG
jgi:hypothetical protein